MTPSNSVASISRSVSSLLAATPGHAAMTNDRILTSLQELEPVLQRLGVRSLFLVADATAYEHSGARQTLAPLLSGYRVISFTNFEPNPKFEDLQTGLAAFQKSDADVILAVGGGTAIDMAKLITTFDASRADPRAIITRKQLLTGTPRPLIVAPTTSGTGSEATQFAVIYLDGIKHSVDHPSLMPSYCVLDTSLTASLPPMITAHTGLDAFCQAIESIWSVRSSDRSLADAEEAAQFILQHLHQAVHSPTPDSRAAMCRAAHLAGRAINQTRTTAPHAISYAITSDYGVPHGQAVALTLGPMLVYNAGVRISDTNDPRGPAHVQMRIQRILNLLECKTPEEGNERIQKFVKSLGCEVQLRKFGIETTAQLKAIADQVNLERLNNNPRRLTNPQLIELLESIL